jgi:hypothetical protein
MFLEWSDEPCDWEGAKVEMVEECKDEDRQPDYRVNAEGDLEIA